MAWWQKHQGVALACQHNQGIEWVICAARGRHLKTGVARKRKNNVKIAGMGKKGSMQ